MCFAPPARLIRLTPVGAEVERGDLRFEVSLLYLETPVAPGDWLAVQAQHHAIEKLTEAEAQQTLELYASIIRHLEGTALPVACPGRRRFLGGGRGAGSATL